MNEVITKLLETVKLLALESGFAGLSIPSIVMILISFVFMYLAIKKGFEPLLLLPIAFGMMLTNLPFAGMYHPELFDTSGGPIDFAHILHEGGLLDLLYLGVKLQIFPPLIFLGIGCMTDFGPLIANPKSFLLGAAAQAGIFLTFIGAAVLGFTPEEAGSIAIIGGADGPTAIYVSTQLLSTGSFDIDVGVIALAAYTYMALVPVIQPPIMRLLTTKKERLVKMETLRPVSKTEKILFPILVTIVIALLIPSATPLVGMLMLGNLFKESGVVERLTKTASNELMNIITIFLGISVGATTTAAKVINPKFLQVLLLGVVAFAVGTAAGVLFGKVMYVATKGKVNPLIGSAGVSAVPMAARISQKVGSENDPTNFLLMHAMGPNVAGVIGSAVAAGVLLKIIPLLSGV
ncbi:MAG: sodium ion-translocating decarboxylase subunit beta [Ruminococcus sp.]|jgi:oxaloacetate decarboxylase beta subunit|nr:sodium ion-translocating decarboxylase subunit beta [Ruminococcus sp.]